jgi:hypothetical protein
LEKKINQGPPFLPTEKGLAAICSLPVDLQGHSMGSDVWPVGCLTWSVRHGIASGWFNLMRKRGRPANQHPDSLAARQSSLIRIVEVGSIAQHRKIPNHPNAATSFLVVDTLISFPTTRGRKLANNHRP